MSQLKVWQANVLSNILLKISNLACYYKRQSAICTDLNCASFLDYAACQKRKQIEMLENIVEVYGEDILAESKTENRDQGDILENLGNKGLDELFDYIKNLSVRDLKMYSMLSNEEKGSESSFLALIDSEEDFNDRLDFRYLDLLSAKNKRPQAVISCR